MGDRTDTTSTVDQTKDRTQVWTFSNDTYTVRLTPTGLGDATFDGVALTRWSGDVLGAAEGFFLYVRDLDRGGVWSISDRPVQAPATRYEAQRTPNGALFRRVDGDLEATLRVGIDPLQPIELRRVTFENHGSEARRFAVTSYAEVVLNDRAADAAHPAFSKLFVQTEYLADRQALVARRRPRSPQEQTACLIHFLAGEGDVASDLRYETDRLRFVGRGRSLAAPQALSAAGGLSGTVGNVLDPVVSVQREVVVPPGGTAVLTFALGAGWDLDAVEHLVEQYRDPEAVERVFATAGASNGMGRSEQLMVIALRAPAYHASQDAAPLPTDGEALRFDNGYGGFSSDGTEYVIRLDVGDEGLRVPPLPWINVIANEHVGFLASEQGAGYTWSGNSRTHRLTPWSNDPVLDPHGEALYLRDEAAGVYWSPLPGPVPGGSYEVRHGFGYTRWRHTSHDLEQEVVQFVPRHDPVKITRLRLTNRSDRPRTLSLFSYARWVLGEAIGDTIRTAWADDVPCILATNPEADAFSEHVAFAGVFVGSEADAVRATADRRAFLGPQGTRQAPEGVTGQTPMAARFGAGLDACAAFQVPIDLAPGATTDVVVLLGDAADRDAALRLVQTYRKSEAVAEALATVQAFWHDLLTTVQVETPAPEIDVMMNGWLLYQNVSCRLWGRSAFFQSGGAFGFRDQLQDASALVYARPNWTRQQILLHAAHQFVEGDVMHWWHPPRSEGLRTRFADDLLWLPFITHHYVRTTGDTAIWDEEAPFLTARALKTGEDEVYLRPDTSGEQGTLYDHVCRAIDRSLTKGPHGLPLMGTGDWNDGMNRVGREGRGESVWLGFFLFDIVQDMLLVCTRRGDTARAARYEAFADDLLATLNDTGWDGAWYRRAYYDSGAPLGSAESDECRIDALAQAWAVLADVAPADRAEQALDAVEQHLISDEDRLIRLLTPAFDKTPHDPGYIKGYLPGIRENGGQYTHAALWVVRAFAEAGRHARAWDLMRMLSPVTHALDAAAADRYNVEPYVIAADVYGVAPHVGRGGWTWYTGSAGWMYRVTLESLLGCTVRGGDTLVLAPRIPNDWPGFTLRYRPFGTGTSYYIDVRNASGAAEPVEAVTLDGAALSVEEGQALVPLVDDGQAHQVVVMLG